MQMMEIEKRSLLGRRQEESFDEANISRSSLGKKIRMFGMGAIVFMLLIKTKSFNNDESRGIIKEIEDTDKARGISIVKENEIQISDKSASTLTKLLYNRLYSLTKQNAVIFGHEADTVYGQSWFAPLANGTSDVYQAIGQYPILTGHNLEQLRLKEYQVIQTTINNWENFGGFAQFMWTAPNPFLNETGTERMCSGHPAHELTIDGTFSNIVWKQYLSQLAELFHSLKTIDGEPIPTVLRLFHEMTGWWYWWSQSCASDDDFVAAWQFTVDYLRNDLQVHNIIVAWCPSKPGDVDMLDAATRRYPGDRYVDLIGWDRYSHPIKYRSGLGRDCDVLLPFAKEHGKLAVLGETGVMNGLEVLNDWPRNFSFTRDFANVLVGPDRNLNCSQIAYAHTWANYNPDRYWTPLPGQNTFDSFVNMSTVGNVLFSSSPEWGGILATTTPWCLFFTITPHKKRTVSPHSRKEKNSRLHSFLFCIVLLYALCELFFI